tara:strand:- start:43 stop:477 length:435 start_codon:yes stop_codon:yes gene_type:complete
MSRIVSFRGSIADGGQETIPLQTNNGLTGYKIVKFQIMPAESANNFESTVKIYSIPQTAVDSVVDFSDNTLLGAAFTGLISGGYAGSKTIIHDNIYFNQDIYVTAQDLSASQNTNYYIELEQRKLDLNEQTVATLKDIRNVGAQ